MLFWPGPEKWLIRGVDYRAATFRFSDRFDSDSIRIGQKSRIAIRFPIPILESGIGLDSGIAQNRPILTILGDSGEGGVPIYGAYWRTPAPTLLDKSRAFAGPSTLAPTAHRLDFPTRVSQGCLHTCLVNFPTRLSYMIDAFEAASLCRHVD